MKQKKNPITSVLTACSQGHEIPPAPHMVLRTYFIELKGFLLLQHTDV